MKCAWRNDCWSDLSLQLLLTRETNHPKMTDMRIRIRSGGFTRACIGLKCKCTGYVYGVNGGTRIYLDSECVYISRVTDDPSRPFPILLGNQWTDQLGWVSASCLWVIWRPCFGPLPRNQGEKNSFHFICSHVLLSVIVFFMMTLHFFLPTFYYLNTIMSGTI